MPNVLDENVVILKFDNSDFKKNTADSVKSIENLKSSLKNADSGESLSKIGKAANRIDLSGLGRSIDTVNKRFSLMGLVGMSAINKLTTSAMSSAARIAKAVPNQIIQGGWRRALNIEQAEFLMEGLGKKFEGTYDKVTKEFTGIKGAVLAAVDGTRYGLDEAAKIASQLMASGITQADDLARRLKSISGLASVTNSEFSDIGRIFSQVAGQGRMMGDDLLQISQRGINAAAKIAEYLNANGKIKQQALDNAIAQGKQVKKMEEISTHAKITEGDVRDMVSAGAISFDVFSSSFEDFFEQAQKANNTYEGSFANVKAALSRMGEQLEAPKLQNMTRIFNTLLPILKQFENFIAPFTAKIAKASNKVTDFINEGILNPIGEAIGVEPDKLFHGLANEIKNAGEESSKAGNKTKDLGDKIKITMKEWQAALDIWNKGTYGTGQKRADAIRELGMSYENVQGIINRFYKNNFNWAKTKSAYDIDSKEQSKNNKENAKSTEEATDRLHEQTQELSVLGKVIKGTINFIKSFVNTMKALKNIAGVVWNNLKGMVSTVGGGLMSGYLKLSEIVLSLSKNFLVFSQILNGSVKLKDIEETYPKLYSILTKLQSPVSIITGALRTLKNGIVDVGTAIRASGVFGKLRTSLATLAKTMISGVAAAIGKIYDGFSNLTKRFTGSGFGATISGVFIKIVNGITNFVNALSGGQQVAGSFMSFLGGVANNIIGLFSPVVDFLIDHFFGAIEKIFDFFTKLGQSEGIQNLKTTLTDLASALFKASEPMDSVVYGMERINGAANGGGNLDKVVNFFSNIAQGLSDFIVAVSKGKNPLETFISVFKKVKDSFSLGGIVDYIKSTIGFKTGQGLNYAFNGIIETFSSFKQWLIDIGALDKVIAAAKVVLGGIDSIIEWINGLDFDAILNKIVNAPWERFSKIGLQFAGIFAMIKTAVDMGKVAKSAAGMFDSIGGMFKSFGSIADTIKTSIKMKSFETLSMSIAILIGSIVALAMIPTDRVKPALAAVGLILGALTAIMVTMSSSKFDAAKLESIGIAFAGVGAGVMLIATSMAMIARISVGGLVKAGAVIGAFMLVMVLLSAKAKEMTGTGAALMGMAVAINLLVTAVLAFAMMPVGVLLHGGAAILGFMIALSLAARVAKSSRPEGFLAMAVALNLLVPAILLMALIPIDMMIRGGSAVVALMLALGKAAQIADGKGFGSIGKMALVIGVLAAACIALSFISPERLLPAAASITALMISLGKAASAAEKNTGAILSMTLMIGVLAGSIIALEKLAPERAVKIALSLSAVFVALGIAMAAFGKLGGGVKAAASAGAGMSVMLLEIVGVVTLIVAAFTGIRKAIDKLAGEESGAKVFEYVGDTMGLIGEAIGKFVGGITSGFMNYSGVQDSLAELTNFVTGISTLADAAAGFKKDKISKLTDFAQSINDLASADLKSAIAKFLGGGEMDISAQMTDFTGGINSLVQGIKEITPDDMKKAKLAADIFGVFAHGAHEMPATGGLTILGSYKSLKDFGNKMKGFGESMEAFIGEMDQVKLEKLQGLIGSGKLDLITQVVNTLMGMDLPDMSLKAQVWTGFSSLKKMGDEMTGFGQSMVTFIGEMDQIPKEKLGGLFAQGDYTHSKFGYIVRMVECLAALQTELDARGGIQQAITGRANLKLFAQDLAGFDGFGTNMATFIAQMSEGIDLDQANDVAEKIVPIAKVVTALAKAGEEIPESGGVEQFLMGTQDIGTYGAQIAQFAIGFKSLFDTFKEVEIEDPEAFQTKIDAIATASASLSGIKPPSSGFFEALSTWAQMKLSAGGINSMLRCIKQVGSSKIPADVATRASEIATASTELGKIKPPSSGFFSALKTWATAKLDSSGITSLVDTLNDVSKAGNKINTSGVAKFSTAVSTVKGSISTFKGIGKIPSGSNLVTLANNMAKFARKMSSIDTSNISSNASAVASSAKSMAKTATSSAASIKGSASSFNSAGSSLASGLAKGMSNTSGVRSAAKKLVSAAKSAINGNALNGVGRQLSAGLASGMRSALGQVRSAADEMERQAERAVKAKAKVKSPSRVFMRIGAYIGEGFAIGIESYSNKVYHASNRMAQKSVDAANEAMSHIDNFASPVITPILDLSDVEQGAQQIESMISTNQALSVDASMNNVASNYATSNLVSELLDKFNAMTDNSLNVKLDNEDGVGATIYNNITVDGAENPEDFANRFVRSLKQEMRTM